MPVKSKAQAMYLGIHHPDVLRKFKSEGASTSTKGLPYKVGQSKKGPMESMFGKRGK